MYKFEATQLKLIAGLPEHIPLFPLVPLWPCAGQSLAVSHDQPIVV